ncbi:hypothetical protein L2E82_15434 [Cichorium intybus]|uniref:Uncharacterized protein n=1 Tax=Cichorium intybus TaxID=13427 RepID=A0ACB9F401_CICIN|nr:hypothetical protein L1887_34852 [Cichorium endivia]KAI3765401.1 hypothetical protein L2E82_15434 [Cichorium intybus]
MTTTAKDISQLLDSHWFQHEILTGNPPPDPVYEEGSHGKGIMKEDEILALTIMNCRNDVEVKGLLRFWAHSVASAVS